MKTVYSGLESSGKSLRLAMVAADILYRNSKWNKSLREAYESKMAAWTKTRVRVLQDAHIDIGAWLEKNPEPVKPTPRAIWSNMRFSHSFEDHARELGVPIHYWTDLAQIVELTNVDVFIDELGNYFDARNWADLPLEARTWITQGDKQGIEMYAAAQDFAQVDLAFRRLTKHLYHVTKLVGSPRPAATKPPVKRIWGVCTMRELNPREYKEDRKSFDKTSIFPSFFTITRQYCEIFDTSQKLARSAAMPMKHVERHCQNPECKDRYGKPTLIIRHV